ncbi:hypothetical protein MP228_004718 [Amoeboaphelidium protococcarum]|nr:hypothetical protein MP228_004718 [Amoeboaphelidium protococcarum]
MPRSSWQKALSNAREYAQQHNVSQSSYVSSAVASKLRLRAAESSGIIADLGSGLDDQLKVQILNGLPNIVNELNNLCNLPDPNEVKDTQPLVKKLLDVILEVIGRKDCRWVIGKEIPSNLGFDTFDNPLQPRVFCPHSCQPDFMLEKIDSIDIIGALAEVKRDVLLQGKALYQIEDNVRQTALSAISYILRVFPMLPPAEIKSIYGDKWYVYAPLLSHRSLFMIYINLSDIYTGNIAVHCSEYLSGPRMAQMLFHWVLWAVRVQDRLIDKKVALLHQRANYCWVPPNLVSVQFREQDSSDLSAAPSFYNPIYVDKTNKRVYKLYSVWSGNDRVIKFALLLDDNLCKDWRLQEYLLCMPLYEGGDLHSNPPSGMLQLKEVLVQLVDILSRLSTKHTSCHCDIRAANICWKDSKTIVLIDYDMSTQQNTSAPKPLLARDRAPDGAVLANHDMWLIGVMILQWTSSNFNWGFVVDRRSTIEERKEVWCDLNLDQVAWKSEFAQYSTSIHKIVENCLQLQEYRWGLQDLYNYLQNLSIQ